MKKISVIIAIAALAASAACTKIVSDDAAPAKRVTFFAANYVPQTKAGEVSFLNEFTDHSTAHFNCKGFLHAEGVSTTQDFFGANGETITWNATKKEWAPSHDYYWPKGASSYINFVSWYDTGVGPTTATETTLEWANRPIGTGDNIMYADEAWRFKENNDSATYGLDGVQEGVPTLFHHALSQIKIQARASKVTNSTANWTITLKEIKVKDIYNQGTLTLTNTDPNTEKTPKAWTGDWAVSGTKGNLTPANLALTDTNQDLLANQSVLPQALSGIALEFKLEIVTTYSSTVSNTEIITKSIPFYAASGEAFSNTISNWEQNKKYIYTLVVEPSEKRVLFDPAVETDWVTVTVPEKKI